MEEKRDEFLESIRDLDTVDPRIGYKRLKNLYLSGNYHKNYEEHLMVFMAYCYAQCLFIDKGDAEGAYQAMSKVHEKFKVLAAKPIQAMSFFFLNYYDAFRRLKAGDYKIAFELLEKIKENSEKEENISPLLKLYVFIMEPEYCFITGINALREGNLEETKTLLYKASALSETVSDKFKGDILFQNTFKGLSQHYKAIYHFNDSLRGFREFDFISKKESINQAIEYAEKASQLMSDGNLESFSFRKLILLAKSVNLLCRIISEQSYIMRNLTQESTWQELQTKRFYSIDLEEKIDASIQLAQNSDDKFLVNEIKSAKNYILNIDRYIARFVGVLNKDIKQQKATYDLIFISNIKTKVSENQLNKVFQELLNSVIETDLLNQIIVLKSSFISMQQAERLKTVSNEDIKVERNRITYSLLQIIDELEENNQKMY